MNIYVAGHRGMVGSALVRALVSIEAASSLKIVTAPKSTLDLRDRSATFKFFAENEKFDWVFLPAAVVGGIHANNACPVEFLDDNLLIATNVMGAAATFGTKKLMFFGSSCVFPKEAEQPIKEEALLTGPLEPTNQWYSIAKIAGVKLAEAYWCTGHNFISVMPCNLYGPGDNYDPKESHVLPGMIHKFHQAKLHGLPVELFGDGTPLREFLHVDDLARACIELMEHYDEAQFVNIGSGTEITIKDLALMIASVVGYDASNIKWNTGMPNGTMRKVMDSARIRALGWGPKIDLRQGIVEAYAAYLHTPFCSAI